MEDATTEIYNVINVRGLFVLESQLFEADQVQFDELYTTRALDLQRPLPTGLEKPEEANRRTTDAFWKHWGKDGWIQDGLLAKFKAFGITHVRVSVGYWMFEEDAGHNRTRDGFVYGSKAKLVEFVNRVARQNMKVIIVMSALPGGQSCCSTTTGRQTCATSNAYGPWRNGEVPDFFLGWTSASINDPSRITTCGVDYGSDNQALRYDIDPSVQMNTPECGHTPRNFFTDNPDHFLSSTYTDTTGNHYTRSIYDQYYPTRGTTGCPSTQFQPNPDIWCRQHAPLGVQGKKWSDPGTVDGTDGTANTADAARYWHLCPAGPLQQRALDAFDQLLHEIYVGGLKSNKDNIYVVPYANMAMGTDNRFVKTDLQYAITTYFLHVFTLLHKYHTKYVTDENGSGENGSGDMAPFSEGVKWLLNDEGVNIIDRNAKSIHETQCCAFTATLKFVNAVDSWAFGYIINSGMSTSQDFVKFNFQGIETGGSFNYGTSMPTYTGVENIYSTSKKPLLNCLAGVTGSCTGLHAPTTGLAGTVFENVLQTTPSYPSSYEFMRSSGDMYSWGDLYKILSGGPSSENTNMWVRVSFGLGGFTAPVENAMSAVVNQALLLTVVKKMFYGYLQAIVFDTARTGDGYRFHSGIVPGMNKHTNFNSGLDNTPPPTNRAPWHFPTESSIAALMFAGRLYDHVYTTNVRAFESQSITT